MDPNSNNDLRMQPIVSKPGQRVLAKDLESAQASAYTRRPRYIHRNPHVSLYAIDARVARQEETVSLPVMQDTHVHATRDVRRRTNNDSSVAVLQQAIRVLAYAIAVIVPSFLVMRVFYFAFLSSDDQTAGLVAHMLYSFWMMATTALVTATLLTTAELLQLLIDIQLDMGEELTSNVEDN
jgi:hypothetical protein